MDAATVAALLEITETSRAALRHEEPGAEAPVEARYADILEALQWLVDRADLTTARRLARSLVNFWMSTSRLPDGDAWFERLLGGPLTCDQDVALSLHEHGYLIFWTGDYERSGRRFTQARVMAAELGDASIEALALAGLARVALTSDVAKAVRLLREALVITEGLPDDSDGRGSALHVLGPALQMGGDFEGAREHRHLTVVLVSNNPYALDRPLVRGTRPTLGGGQLGIVVVDAPGDSPGPPGRAWSAPHLEVSAPEPVHAGIDGEAVDLEPPLRFTSRPASLRVRISPRHPGASPSALLREVADRRG